MKRVVEKSGQASMLDRWRGATAKLWLYHVSLGRMALRLESDREGEVLYLVAVACAEIHGPFSWIASDLAISERDGEFVIEDRGAGFSLRCSSVVMARTCS